MKIIIEIEGRESVEMIVLDQAPTVFNKAEEPKWVAFCKAHNLNRYHTHGKWYDLYLRLCADGLL